MKTASQIQESANKLNFKVSNNKKAFNELHNHVQDNEEILALFDTSLHLVALTNNKLIIIKAGMLMSTDVTDISLDNIQQIKIDGKLLYTEVEITSGGKKTTLTVNKKEVANTIKNTINEAMNKKNTPSSTPSGGDDIMSQLEKLASLKEKGILSESEFNEQKQKLLAKM